MLYDIDTRNIKQRRRC